MSKTQEWIRTLGMHPALRAIVTVEAQPMLPMLALRDTTLCMQLFYRICQAEGQQLLLYPPRFAVTVLEPSGRVAGVQDLKFLPGPTVDFGRPTASFPISEEEIQRKKLYYSHVFRQCDQLMQAAEHEKVSSVQLEEYRRLVYSALFDPAEQNIYEAWR